MPCVNCVASASASPVTNGAVCCSRFLPIVGTAARGDGERVDHLVGLSNFICMWLNSSRSWAFSFNGRLVAR